MRISGLLYILFTIAVITGTGCHNRPGTSVYLSKTDSIIVRFDSTFEVFKKIDAAMLKQRMDLSKSTAEQLKQIRSKNADSLILEYGHKYRIYKHLVKEYAAVSKEIKFSRKQLSDLRYDLKNNLLKEGKDSLYYHDERKAYNRLRRQVSLFYQRIKTQNRQFDELKKFTDSLFSNKLSPN